MPSRGHGAARRLRRGAEEPGALPPDGWRAGATGMGAQPRGATEAPGHGGIAVGTRPPAPSKMKKGKEKWGGGDIKSLIKLLIQWEKCQYKCQNKGTVSAKTLLSLKF